MKCCVQQESPHKIVGTIHYLSTLQQIPWIGYTRCAWAGGTFFPVVLLCQFLVVVGNRFLIYLLCTYILRVQYSCGVVSVFWFWWEIVFAVMYVLSVHYSCAVVSVFWLWREIVL